MVTRVAAVVLCAGVAAGESPVRAAEGTITDMDDDARTVAEKGEGSNDLLIVPIPLSNPAVASGVALTGLYISHPDPRSQPWVTGAGFMYTSNNSWAVAAFHSMSLDADRFRVRTIAGYADLNLDFYGIGSEAGARDTPVAIDDRGIFISLQGQMRIGRNLYIGPKYKFQRLRSRLHDMGPLSPGPAPPAAQLKSQVSAIGPLGTYDTRDDMFSPGEGVLITVDMGFNTDLLGSDFNYSTLDIAANLYKRVTPGTILVVRETVCAVSRGAPYYDLCLYGQASDLRGYESGQYRDRASWTLQLELRQHLRGRLGAVVFGGVGGIAPNLGKLGHTEFLPAAGAGLRYVASEANNVNLRLDVAFGKDSHGVYFGIGEAF